MRPRHRARFRSIRAELGVIVSYDEARFTSIVHRYEKRTEARGTRDGFWPWKDLLPRPQGSESPFGVGDDAGL